MNPDREIGILALTDQAVELAHRLARSLQPARVYPCRGDLPTTLARCWHNHQPLVCIMAAGIVVRTLAPLLDDKRRDPPVVVCDEKGEFAIALVSGHLGGGNELARRVAAITGGTPVITTGSDVQGLIALDLWARDLGLIPHDRRAMTRVMGRLVDRGWIRIHSDIPLPPLPTELRWADSPEQADCWITCRVDGDADLLRLYPPALAAGIGCNRNTPAGEIRAALDECCADNGLARQSVARLATIDLKGDEPGLLEFAHHLGMTLRLYSRDQLNQVQGITPSETVFKATGAWAVAEPAARLAADNGPLAVAKMKWTNVTCALAWIQDPLGVNKGQQGGDTTTRTENR